MNLLYITQPTTSLLWTDWLAMPFA